MRSPFFPLFVVSLGGTLFGCARLDSDGEEPPATRASMAPETTAEDSENVPAASKVSPPPSDGGPDGQATDELTSPVSTDDTSLSATAEQWAVLAAFLNRFADEVDEFHYFIWHFDSARVQDLEDRAASFVASACGAASPYQGNVPPEWLEKSELSREAWSSRELPQLLNTITETLNRAAASSARNPALPWGEVGRSVRELRDFLQTHALAPGARVTKISSAGDCSGRWLHEYWGVETLTGERFSLSVGGGE